MFTGAPMNQPRLAPPLSSEANQLINLAVERAREAKKALTSEHLLWAFFGVDNLAQNYLRDHRVDPDRLQPVLFDGEEEEPDGVLGLVWSTAQTMAGTGPDKVITSFHLLAGLLRYHASSGAVRALRQAGCDTNKLRNTLISYLTAQRRPPRRITQPPVAESLAGPMARYGAEQIAAGVTAEMPALRRPEAATVQEQAPVVRNTRVDDASGPASLPASPTAPNPYGFGPDHPLTQDNPYLQHLGPPIPAAPASPRPVARTARPQAQRPVRPLAPKVPRQAAQPTIKSEPDALKDRLKGRFGSRKPRRNGVDLPSMKRLAESIFGDDLPQKRRAEEARRDDSKAHPARRPSGPAKEIPAEKPLDLGAEDLEAAEAAGDSTNTPEATPREGEAAAKKQDTKPSGARAQRPAARNSPRRSHAELRRLAEHYKLSEKEYPTLAKLGRNLSLEAVRGDLDGLVGRADEIEQIIDILGRRRSNNPILVGPAGVGKTAIVEGLAVDLVGRMGDGTGLGDRVVVELEMGRVLSGTQLRGSFSERLLGIKDEVLKAGGRVIIFLDEIHTWMGAGASGDGADAAGEFKAALARGQFPCVGATTPQEYARFIENDPAFKRRFQLVEVGEPSPEEAVEIIRGVIASYQEHHKVEFEDEAVAAAVQFSRRYIPDLMLPAKAIGLLDTAGSRARRKNQDKVTRTIVAEVVSDRTGVPVDKLLMRDRERFLRMEEQLSASLIGHADVIQRVSQVIRRNYAGFHSGRPIGSFLFLGPTGVGKTELVKVLADFLFRDRNAMVRIDMSEYREAHAVSRLIGAPPGYVGYEHGGQLTEAVRRKPYQIVLFDEVEKAHPEVLNVLLQLLDDGHLTDGRGRKVDFSNTVIILTSNLGSGQFRAGLAAVTRTRIGFGGLQVTTTAYQPTLTPEIEQEVVSIARSALSPELWNRIEERLVFGPLSRSEVACIAHLQLRDSSRRLAIEREVYLETGDGLLEYLIDHGGYDPQLGARPMRQTIGRLVEAPVSELILDGSANPGDHVLAHVEGGILQFTITDC